MTINLYNYYSKDNIENVFCWLPNQEPYQEQWWITGFNPNFTSSDPEIMVTIGSVDFTGHEGMYEALKSTTDITSNNYNPEASNYLIFDDNDKTVWITWG